LVLIEYIGIFLHVPIHLATYCISLAKEYLSYLHSAYVLDCLC